VDEENLATQPRVVVPRNNNKRGSTVIRLIKRNNYQDQEDN
jgi:hypothetical protein